MHAISKYEYDLKNSALFIKFVVTLLLHWIRLLHTFVDAYYASRTLLRF
jgi:hypothetical protein